MARTGTRLNFDAIVVGVGVGGLYAIHRLRKLGLKARAFEAAADFGGGLILTPNGVSLSGSARRGYWAVTMERWPQFILDLVTSATLSQ